MFIYVVCVYIYTYIYIYIYIYIYTLDCKNVDTLKALTVTVNVNRPSILRAYFFPSNVFFIAENKNSKLLIIMMEMRSLFKHYPQIRRVSSFTVYAFKVSTFLQSSVYIWVYVCMYVWMYVCSMYVYMYLFIHSINYYIFVQWIVYFELVENLLFDSGRTA